MTRSTLCGRSHRAHLAPRIPDCPVTVTRSTLCGRSHRAHLAPRIPDGSPAAVRSTPSSRNRKTAHAHRLSDGCPVAAIRSAPCDSEATEHVTHLDSRTGSPVAVRSAPSSRNQKTTRAHRLLDGCPVAAIRLLHRSRSCRRGRAPQRPDGCPVTARSAVPGRNQRRRRAHRLSDGARSQHAQPTLAEASDDIAHIDSWTGARCAATRSARYNREAVARVAQRNIPDGCPAAVRSLAAGRNQRRGAHIDFRTGARSPSHALPTPAETREDVTYTDCRTGVPVPAHPAHDQRTNSVRPGRALQGRGAPVDDRSRQRLLARLRSTTRSTRHPPATEAVRVRRIQPKKVFTKSCGLENA